MLPRFLIYPAMFTLGLLTPVVQLGGRPNQQIGEITFEGSSFFTTKKLAAIAGVKPKQDYKPETIERVIGRIKIAYLERGFFKANITVGTSAQGTSGKKECVNLKITIDEGPRYFVLKTEVIGNEMTNHGVVMRAAGLRPGEPYNPARIDKWVEGLNRLGRFEPVTREDIHIEVHEEELCIHVLFHLKEKPGLRIRNH